MKKFLRRLPIFLALFSFNGLIAQDSVDAKVKWEFSGNKSGNGNYKLILKGTIEPGWGLFSITMPDDMPNTRVAADSSTGIINSIKEKGKRVDEKNALLEAEIKYFKDIVEIEVEVDIEGTDGRSKGNNNLYGF